MGQICELQRISGQHKMNSERYLGSIMKAGRKVLVWIAALLADRLFVPYDGKRWAKDVERKGANSPLPWSITDRKKNTGLQLHCGCLRKKKMQLRAAIIQARLWRSVFSLCWAAACRDTCVISLSGMATTMGFLQTFHFILALKKI